MGDILHILTRADDALAAEVIERQKEAGQSARIIDLTVASPDYQELVKTIFEVDSVQTW